MTPHVIEIAPWQLGVSLVLILVAGITSLTYGLGLGRDLLIGTIRTFAQLFLLGYILRFVFGLNYAWLVLTVFLIMIGFAAYTIRGRVKEKQVSFFWPLLASMLLSYSLVAVLVTGVIVGVKPWWKPQYFLPLGGMIVGNSMTAIALALERLFGELRSRRDEVEMMLCLGADYREAGHSSVVSAMKAGMIPSINSMMAVGIVFIPGMMTGQILAGADPVTAIRYQIVVMIMLVASTAIGSLLVVLLVRRRCFGPGHQLRLTPEKISS